MPLSGAGLRWFERRLSRRAPLLGSPAPALDGGLGCLPFGKPAGRSNAGVPLPTTTPQDRQPPWYRIPAGRVGPSERQPHRHGWLAAACWSQDDVGAALGVLEAWLGEDRPGHGGAWVHTTDLTARLLHWLLALAWLGPRAGLPLRRALAGSAALHLDQLEARLSPLAPGDPRRVFQLVGLAAGALGWPSLPGAAERAGRALSALPDALEALLGDDGVPRNGDLALLPELLTHGLLLHRLARAARHPLPRRAEAALRSAAQPLAALVEAGLPLPEAPVEPLLPLEGVPAVLVHQACAAVDWSRATARPGADELARALVGTTPDAASAERPPCCARVFRPSGLVLWESAEKPGRSRLLFQLRGAAAPGRSTACDLAWSVGGLAVLAPPHPERGAPGMPGNLAHIVPTAPPRELRLREARFEARGLRVVASAAGVHHGRHERALGLQGTRLWVEDRLEPPPQGFHQPSRAARARLGWQLGPGWRLTREGGSWVGRAAGRTLRVDLDPALTWSMVVGSLAPGGGWVRGAEGGAVEAPLLLGEGMLPAERALRCCFVVS